MPSVEAIWQDTRYALRGMKKRPGFTTLAVATLALGVGVNAASLAVAYGILVRPLPYAEPSRVVILNLLFADGGDLDRARDLLDRGRLTQRPPKKVPRYQGTKVPRCQSTVPGCQVPGVLARRNVAPHNGTWHLGTVLWHPGTLAPYSGTPAPSTLR